MAETTFIEVAACHGEGAQRGMVCRSTPDPDSLIEPANNDDSEADEGDNDAIDGKANSRYNSNERQMPRGVVQ